MKTSVCMCVCLLPDIKEKFDNLKSWTHLNTEYVALELFLSSFSYPLLHIFRISFFKNCHLLITLLRYKKHVCVRLSVCVYVCSSVLRQIDRMYNNNKRTVFDFFLLCASGKMFIKNKKGIRYERKPINNIRIQFSLFFSA